MQQPTPPPPPNLNLSMANYSLLYLQQPGLPIECSVYSVSGGELYVTEWGDRPQGSRDVPPDGTPDSHPNGQQPSFNVSQLFLPAYYITNCSIPYLMHLVVESNISSVAHAEPLLLNNPNSPYNQRDNGDTFVALLFTISGSCVSCWMLTLLLYLSPRHKRKPWVAQLATVFYAIVTTILVSKITTAARIEYFLDTLDIITLHNDLYDINIYRATAIISQTLTHAAWFEIVLKITKDKYKWLSGIGGGTIMLAYTIICIYHDARYNRTTSIFNSNLSANNQTWRVLRVVLKLVIMTWLAVSLFIFTVISKNPYKISYSKKLFPLGAFNWVVIVSAVTLNILTLSLYRDSWLVKTWLEMLPYLLEVISITTLWEWIYNIGFLEKRYELSGMLGRRISAGDVESVHSKRPDEKPSKMLNKIFDIGRKKPDLAPVEEVSDWSSKELTASGSDSPANQTINGGSSEPDLNRSDPGADNHASGDDTRDQEITGNHGDTVQQHNTPTINPADHSIQNNDAMSYNLEGGRTGSNDNNTHTRSTSNIGNQAAVTSVSVTGEIHHTNADSLNEEHVSFNETSLGAMQSSLAQSFDDEYVDNYNWDEDEEEQPAPPPFQSHSGFSHDDYWTESKH